jgi:hypothetical protein
MAKMMPFLFRIISNRNNTGYQMVVLFRKRKDGRKDVSLDTSME